LHTAALEPAVVVVMTVVVTMVMLIDDDDIDGNFGDGGDGAGDDSNSDNSIRKIDHFHISSAGINECKHHITHSSIICR
jgi:hypothetical protein